MRSNDEHPRALEEGESYRELRLLEEVDNSPDISQRQIARKLGIALGVANLLVRRGAKRGYIRVAHLGWKRWAYFVTPKGVSRKLHLTLAYIDRFLQHYRRVRLMLREDIASLPLNKESRVALIGTAEMAEFAYLALRDIGVDDIEVFEFSPGKTSFLGMTVNTLDLMDPGVYAKIVVADLSNSDSSRKALFASGVSDSQLVELLQARPRLAAVDSDTMEAS